MNKLAHLLWFILIVTLSACSRPEKAEENVPPPTGHSSSIPQPSAEKQPGSVPKAETETTPPEASANVPAPRVPRDFPLEVVAGAKLMSETPPDQEGKANQKVVFKSNKPFDELVSFYEKALQAKNLEIRKTTHQQGNEKQFLMLGQANRQMAGVMVLNKQGEAFSTVVLTWTKMEMSRE